MAKGARPASNPARKETRGTPAGPTPKNGRRGAPPGSKIARKRGSAVTTLSRIAAKTRTRAQSRSLATRAHADAVWGQLLALYPKAHCELEYSSPWQLLVATILSAQCTDRRVNMVTPELFAHFSGPEDLAAAPVEEVERIIRSTGFFRAKARALVGVASALVERHGSQVPPAMDQLVVLPGVGRKTANVVLGNAFGLNIGVVVDTHVGRLAARLGLTSEHDPVKVEQDLMRLFPHERWTLLSHLLIWHGRRVCDARKPRCGECSLNDICPSSTA